MLLFILTSNVPYERVPCILYSISWAKKKSISTSVSADIIQNNCLLVSAEKCNNGASIFITNLKHLMSSDITL